jgi:hypothetical protein
MGAEVVFAIETFGVAQVGLTGGGPRLLLAEHLEGDAPLLRLRMGALDTTMAELERRGLRTESRFGIPHGPCAASISVRSRVLAVTRATDRVPQRRGARGAAAPRRGEP